MSALSLNSDEHPFDPADPNRPAKPPRPRDAATLILVRRRRNAAEVLMGQRAKGHVFMPDKWVFPGGRVEPADAKAPAATEPTPESLAQLRDGNVRRPARAFPLAAVRETFEEAGLIVGRRGGPPGPAPKGWAAYSAHNAAPELDKLAFICRAVTPPFRTRRFDARFFLANAEEVLLSFDAAPCEEELLHTRWFAFEDAAKLDLPSVTRFVLGEVSARLTGAETRGPAFLRWSRKGHVLERL